MRRGQPDYSQASIVDADFSELTDIKADETGYDQLPIMPLIIEIAV
jgi:hypothetical protein